MNLKPFLVLSAILNLLFAGVLVLGMTHRGTLVSAAVHDGSVTPAPACSDVSKTHTASFQWSDLDSDDYPTFIQNLRSIDCPEQTIRNIVSAEITSDYDQKLLEIKGLPLAQLAQAREALIRERAGVIESLLSSSTVSATSLGSAPLENRQTTQADPDSDPAPGQSAVEQPSLPLFYLKPDATVVGTDEAKLNAWKNLQQRFTASVGGQFQNPYDPEYRKRWESAQNDLDEAFHSQFGDDAFNSLLQQRKTAENQPTR
jgi:hypothetical protein